MLRSLISNRLQWKFQSFIHTNANADSPSQMLRSKFMQMKNSRKPKKKKEVMVEVPESKSYLDTATVPMVLTAVAFALFMKMLMTISQGCTTIGRMTVAVFQRPFYPGHCEKHSLYLPLDHSPFDIVSQYDDSKAQERIERRARKAPPEQGSVRMLTREEWEEFREVRPRTPFESRIARPNARLRTGDSTQLDDVKDWSIDVLTDAFTRVEENVQHNIKNK